MPRTARPDPALPAARRPAGSRARLLACAAVAALGCGYAVHAQESGKHAPKPPVERPDDGLGPRDIYLQSDTLIDDRAQRTVTGEGHVEARYGGRTLRAKQVVYDTVTGAAHAIGDVVIINADGTSEYGQDIQLDDQLRTGVALGFAARLEQNVTIVAGAAVRRSELVNELNRAVYTPCAICKADGVTPKTPTWSVQATRIIQDRQHQVIYYKNAIIRVKGVPVLYFPVFWHPDPSSPRRSGFLAPRIQYSKRRGLSYEQGYLLALNPSTDLVISPQFNTAVRPLLNLHLTEQFYSGKLDIRTGYTNERLFDSHGTYGNATNRSYILAQGRFNLTDEWDWGFGAERVTDPTFFRRYSVQRVFLNRGDFPADTDRLISQVYTTREDQQSYLSISALSFQSERQNGQTTDIENGKSVTRATFETSKAFPIVGPLIEARWDPNFDLFGGRLRARGSAVVLTRSDDVYAATDPVSLVSNGAQRLSNATSAGLVGVTPANGQALAYNDERRASGVLDWRRDFALPDGVRLQSFAEARGDVYSLGDPRLADDTRIDPATGKPGLVTASSDLIGRALGTVGATVSWPLIRQVGASSLIVEPIAQFALSPHVGRRADLPNEDSVAFEFDETNLFSFNRFPGFDEYEGGARANVGARANLLWGAGRSANLTIGRVFRTEDDEVFTAQSGLRRTASDYVVAATANPIGPISVFTRSRLDADDFKLHREEAGIDVNLPQVHGGIRYSYNENGLFVDGSGVIRIGKVEDANIGLEAYPLRNWGVSVNATRDLQQKITPVSQFGLIYHDECIRVDVIYTHDETFAAAIGSSNSVTVRLTLATLGDASQAGRRRSESR